MYSLTTLILSLLIAVTCLGADTKVFSYYSPLDKSLKEINISNYQGINLSASCLKGKIPQCEAWSATQKKATDPDRRRIGAVGNPAAAYCASYKSKNIIFLDSKKKEYDYCLFSDNSAVDAWDLYYKHHK